MELRPNEYLEKRRLSTSLPRFSEKQTTKLSRYTCVFVFAHSMCLCVEFYIIKSEKSIFYAPASRTCMHVQTRMHVYAYPLYVCLRA